MADEPARRRRGRRRRRTPEPLPAPEPPVNPPRQEQEDGTPRAAHRSAIGIETLDTADPQPSGRRGRTALAQAPETASRPSRTVPAALASSSARMAFGGRFGSPAGALACLGELAGAQRGDDLILAQSADGAWWVTLTVEVDIGRAVVEAGRGQSFLLRDGRYVPDRGFGTAGRTREDPGVDPATLVPRTLLELVHRTRLQPARARPLRAVSVLLPVTQVPQALRRALDLGLGVQHRLVRLTPLFGESLNGSSPPAQVMVRLDIESAAGAIPAQLLALVARFPLALVARSADPAGILLIQQGMTAPLPDIYLAALAGNQPWVLADAAFGCWLASDLSAPQPCTDLFEPADGFALTDQVPGEDQAVVPPARVTLMPNAERGQPIDALLIDEADRDMLTLLLEGHPLADQAEVVLGRDLHLVLAPGGLLDAFVVGTALTCIGPRLLYIPRGMRLSPRLPPTARARLYGPDSAHAVVVLKDGGLRFSLSARRPAWTLWTPASVQLTDEFPDETTRALLDLAPPPPAERAPRLVREILWEGASRAPTREQLLHEAQAAEDAGNFEHAAQLHLRLGHPLQAGNLFERAATLHEP
jgi:hypothetical protein